MAGGALTGGDLNEGGFDGFALADLGDGAAG